MQYNKIRWRDNDDKELRRVVNNFNRKIRRLQKKGVNADILPSTINYKNIKNNITTRNDFNKTIRKYSAFTKRNAEKLITNEEGFTRTSWEIREVAIAIRNINIRRAKELNKVKNYDVTSRGVKQGYNREYLPNERLDELSPKSNRTNKIKNKAEWDKFVETVEKQMFDNYSNDKKELYKANYLKALKKEFVGIPNLNEYIKLLEKVSPDVYMKAYYSDQEGEIRFIYDPLELQCHFNALVDMWIENGFIERRL